MAKNKELQCDKLYKYTTRQIIFCDKVLELSNYSDAYREGYSTKNMKPATIHRLAHELKNTPKIAARIKELRNKEAKKAEITREDITNNYIWALETAKERVKNYGDFKNDYMASYIKANEKLAKHLGFETPTEIKGGIDLLINVINEGTKKD